MIPMQKNPRFFKLYGCPYCIVKMFITNEVKKGSENRK